MTYPAGRSMIPWSWVSFAVAACVLLIVAFAGCATYGEEQYAYENREPIKPLEPLVSTVKDVALACRHIGARVEQNTIIMGCSDPWGRVVRGRCLVLVPADDPGWIREHELRHCKYGRWHA